MVFHREWYELSEYCHKKRRGKYNGANIKKAKKYNKIYTIAFGTINQLKPSGHAGFYLFRNNLK